MKWVYVDSVKKILLAQENDIPGNELSASYFFLTWQPLKLIQSCAGHRQSR